MASVSSRLSPHHLCFSPAFLGCPAVLSATHSCSFPSLWHGAVCDSLPGSPCLSELVSRSFYLRLLPLKSSPSLLLPCFLLLSVSVCLSHIVSVSLPLPLCLPLLRILTPHPDWRRHFIRSHSLRSFEVKTRFLEFPGEKLALEKQKSLWPGSKRAVNYG